MNKERFMKLSKIEKIRVIKHFKPTGRDMTVHIKQDDGRIWYCPENNIIKVKE